MQALIGVPGADERRSGARVEPVRPRAQGVKRFAEARAAFDKSPTAGDTSAIHEHPSSCFGDEEKQSRE